MIFVNQMDYVFFIYGFSFILLGIVSSLLMRKKRKELFWGALFAFGIIHGLNEWLDMIVGIVGDSVQFQFVRSIFALFSFVALLEFGRKNLYKTLPFFTILIIPCFVALSLFDDITTFGIFVRYFVGFPSALIAAYVFYKNRTLPYFKIIATCFIIYAFASGGVVPASDFLPASIINQQNFLNLVGFPIQILRALVATIITISAYMHFRSRTKKHTTEWFISGRALALTMIILLGLGWFFTQLYSSYEEQRAKAQFLEASAYAASMIKVEDVKKFTASEKDVHSDNWMFIRESFKNLRSKYKELLYCYILQIRNEKVVFLLDSEDMSSRNYFAPGMVYSYPPLDFERGYKEKKNLFVGPYSNKAGHFVSTYIPLIDPVDETVIASIGFDMSASDFYARINQKRFVVILITFLLSSIWLITWSLIRVTLTRSQEKIEMQSQLIHSDKLASIGMLAAGVAHEINNPLAIALGYFEMLTENLTNKGLVDKPLATLLEAMSAAMTRVQKIVRSLNSFARVDHERIEGVDLHRVIQDTVTLCSSIYANEGIFIQTEFNCPKFIFSGNTGKAQQVIMNFLSNARDAIKEKKSREKGLITFQTGETPEVIFCKIMDNGIGIRECNASRLFEPFFTTKGPGKGTGLGLAISNSIIADYGGKISCESKEGEGTVFTITFPIEKKMDPKI